jgi:hypothetical protein
MYAPSARSWSITPGLSPTDKEKVLRGEDEVCLNLRAAGVVRLVAEEGS